MIRCYMATDIGHMRPNNEDRVQRIEPETYIVADGMGGHAAGEVASAIMIDVANEMLSSVSESSNVSEMTLKKIILRANERIIATVSEHKEYDGMGTTATMFHYCDGIGYFAHVGDSRLYYLRDGALKQVTHDHTYVNDLLAKGKITPEEAENHPQRNVLMRAVGIEENLIVDTGTFNVRSGDCIMMCSDGLYSVVHDTIIEKILNDSSDNDKAKELVTAALENESKDNISAIVIFY